MQVVLDTTILGEVKNAIAEAEANGTAIKQIILTREEMDEFVSSSEFKHNRSLDSHYGALSVPVPSNIIAEKEKVVSCFYKGVNIITEPVELV